MELIPDDPIIRSLEDTGMPPWAQEILEDFEGLDEMLPKMSERNEIIYDAIPYGHERAISREALAALTGLSDRQVRKGIEELRRTHIILNDQDGKGYYRSYNHTDLLRSYRQERARALAILYRMKPIRTILRGGGLL